MSVAQGGLSENCPYCLLPREIIAVRFSLFKPCTALFVCPSCGSTFADIGGPSRKRGRSLHLKAYLFLRRKRAHTVSLA
jgi:transposase-like protein